MKKVILFIGNIPSKTDIISILGKEGKTIRHAHSQQAALHAILNATRKEKQVTTLIFNGCPQNTGDDPKKVIIDAANKILGKNPLILCIGEGEVSLDNAHVIPQGQWAQLKEKVDAHG